MNDQAMAFPGHDEAGVRALLCIGVTQSWFDADRSRLAPVGDALKEAFSGLRDRFGVEVLGTLDDDTTMVGPTVGWPWTSYILVHAPDREAVAALCNLLRVTLVDGERLAKYVKVEARIGHSLFFGES
jgi:hypothetical protein